MEEELFIPERPDYEAELLEILDSDAKPSELRERLDDYHENDIADALEVLKKDERFRLYSILDTETLASIFEYSEKISVYMGELGIRKRVDVLSHLEVTTAVEYLRQLGKSDRYCIVGSHAIFQRRRYHNSYSL